MPKLPNIITLTSESSSELSYDNHPIAYVNNHVVRISVMTRPYQWHSHPNSDETFLVIEGRLKIEFDIGSVELGPGQMATVPRGFDTGLSLLALGQSTSPSSWIKLRPSEVSGTTASANGN